MVIKIQANDWLNWILNVACSCTKVAPTYLYNPRVVVGLFIIEGRESEERDQGIHILQVKYLRRLLWIRLNVAT